MRKIFLLLLTMVLTFPWWLGCGGGGYNDRKPGEDPGTAPVEEAGSVSGEAPASGP